MTHEGCAAGKWRDWFTDMGLSGPDSHLLLDLAQSEPRPLAASRALGTDRPKDSGVGKSSFQAV